MGLELGPSGVHRFIHDCHAQEMVSKKCQTTKQGVTRYVASERFSAHMREDIFAHTAQSYFVRPDSLWKVQTCQRW